MWKHGPGGHLVLSGSASVSLCATGKAAVRAQKAQ